MRGLPSCGKSTRAEELIKEYGNFVRINKDLLRTMLHFDVFTGKNEGLTRDASRGLAKMYLEKNTSVIIDDTNLNPGTMQSWKDLAKELNVKVEVVDMTDVPTEICVFRDNERVKNVGGTVIKNMAIRYGLHGFAPDSVVLCDIDGTIADTDHRVHYVKVPEGEKKNWKGFFSEMHLDPVRKDVQKILIDYYNQGKTIIFLSARPDIYKDVTLKWLADNFLTFAYTIIMRPSHDKRPDNEVKKDMFNMYFPDKGVIHAVLDDRPSIIRVWKELGLPNVTDVGKGQEF